jgi:hypothetical protein
MAAAVLTAMLAVVLFVPIALPPPEIEPDQSLRATIDDAFARHLQIGTDIVSTYGPWGILQRGDTDPRTARATIALTSAIALAFAFALLMAAHDAGAGPGRAALIVVAVAALLAAAGNDGRFLAVEYLALLWTLLPPRTAREILLVALLAVVGLIKFSYLAAALFILVAIVCIRRRLVYLIVFGATFGLAWVGAGQRLAGLPSFLMNGAAVMAGYAGAQALPHAMTLELVSAIVGAAGLTLLVAFVERDILRTLAIAALLALTMKISYVRYDDAHALAAEALIPFIGISYVLIRANHPRLARARRGVVFAGAIAVAGIIAIDGQALVDRIANNWRWLHGRSQKIEQLRRAEAGEKVPAVKGTIDAYPWGSAALISQGLAYSPRPVFESHLAFTPALAELNTQRLRGAAAPLWLWVSIESIDHYPPLLADGPSWLEIISRYDFASRERDHLLLRRRGMPIPIVRRVLATPRARFDEDLALPDAGDALLWCSIDVSPSPGERFAGIVARPSQLTIRTTSARGDQALTVAPVAMARGGFLLSPAVTSADAFEALVVSRDAHAIRPSRVTRIAVSTEGMTPAPFGDRFTLRVEAITFQLSR